jgi:hypothetical protein
MRNDLPTRMCDGCGQVWASGSFLDPTVEAECGYCGGRLPHRRRLPDTVAVELVPIRQPVSAREPELPARVAG